MRFTREGGRLIEALFPVIEEFVYAAVYFRQLFSGSRSDHLFRNVCDRYVHFAQSPKRANFRRIIAHSVACGVQPGLVDNPFVVMSSKIAWQFKSSFDLARTCRAASIWLLVLAGSAAAGLVFDLLATALLAAAVAEMVKGD